MENEIYKSPEAELVPQVDDIDNELASRGARFLASIIDSLTILPISLTIMYLTGGFEGIAEGQQLSILYTLTLALVSTVIFLLIHGKIMLRDGQTWGKKSQSIKIVTVDGEHADLKTLAKRYGFYWVIPQIPLVGQFINLVNVLFIFSKSKRCIHDHVGGTKVIKAHK
ncbi:RDD family protein [Paraglaciecola sp. 2405UD69-4]|uniref:RDD family protein n=1 Tax=Paraglaciecola sp. 2405UD69-4 TaxID=3391836 RepID=UPI0039C8EB89